MSDKQADSELNWLQNLVKTVKKAEVSLIELSISLLGLATLAYFVKIAFAHLWLLP